jgi:gamma-butyrobetaine dioxygenase
MAYAERVLLPIDLIAQLFAGEGLRSYLGEEVSIATHMLQAASLAEGSGASNHLVAAALLHDPVRLHVMAKRYLCAVEPDYFARLSPASVQTLALQGGPLTEGEARAFESMPHARAAVAVRRWDEAAKDPAMAAPPFDHFRPLLSQIAT